MTSRLWPALAALALAGCVDPAPVATTSAPVPEPFEAEGVWWIEPSSSEMSQTRIDLDLDEALAALVVDVAARSTYVVDVPWVGEAAVELIDPEGRVAADATLREEPEARLMVEDPMEGAWTLALRAYGGSGNGMGDSIFWRAVGDP